MGKLLVASLNASSVGVKDRETKTVRANVVPSTDAETLQGFIRWLRQVESTVYTDEAGGYRRLTGD